MEYKHNITTWLTLIIPVWQRATKGDFIKSPLSLLC